MDRALVQKTDVQPAAITRDRRGSGGGVGLFSGVWLAAMHLRLPDQFPGPALETQHGLAGFCPGPRWPGRCDHLRRSAIHARFRAGGPSITCCSFRSTPPAGLGRVPQCRRGLARAIPASRLQDLESRPRTGRRVSREWSTRKPTSAPGNTLQLNPLAVEKIATSLEFTGPDCLCSILLSSG